MGRLTLQILDSPVWYLNSPVNPVNPQCQCPNSWFPGGLKKRFSVVYCPLYFFLIFLYLKISRSLSPSLGRNWRVCVGSYSKLSSGKRLSTEMKDEIGGLFFKPYSDSDICMNHPNFNHIKLLRQKSLEFLRY